ncbi:hypothetical protein [Maribacter antarcticus]|uniref:hypothetical protein n=1 Tax=Maribacter antarcticus TaxID=505250 RepID=UPI000478985F|nr:hypothetical protein [Maribacter antarcticus]
MKKSIQLLCIICIFICSTAYGQKQSQLEVQKLVDILNLTMSERIQLNIEKNKAILQWDSINKNFDLRDKAAIAKDSLSKEEIDTRLYTAGRYIGNIFWQYDFDPVSSLKTSFKANQSGKIFFTLAFPVMDTILIRTNLNEYTSHHRVLDSRMHSVIWSGENYISILLQPEKVTNTIQFKVRGITISGKFERRDQHLIHKNYTKNLRVILRREFQVFFDDILLTLNSSEDAIGVSSVGN